MLYFIALIGVFLIIGGLFLCRQGHMRTKQKKRKLAEKSATKQKKG